MTIEKSLERIAEALEYFVNQSINPLDPESRRLNKMMGTKTREMRDAPVPAPVAKVEPVPAPVAEPEPIIPDFMGVVEVPTCPITDQKSLLAYVMDAYTTMGPEKGAKIQDVLTGIGAAHLNDVKTEHYGTIFTAVEELKK